MSTMCALSTALAACASRWKRATASAFCTVSASMNSIATRLPMARLSASYTVPMPPRPMTRTMSYLWTRFPTSASLGAAAAGGEPGSGRVVMGARGGALGGEIPYAPYQRNPPWSWSQQVSSSPRLSSRPRFLGAIFGSSMTRNAPIPAPARSEAGAPGRGRLQGRGRSVATRYVGSVGAPALGAWASIGSSAPSWSSAARSL